MSIVAADLVVYCAANMPSDDVSTVGGAIDTQRRVVFSELGANSKVEVFSSAAGDTTQTVTVIGRKADGSITSEPLALNGTTVVQGAITFERLESVELSGTAVGTVTIRRFGNAGAIGTIPIGELAFVRLFRNAFSDPSSGKDYYMKVFYKNTNGSLAYINATVIENADPTGDITFAVEDAVGDVHTVATRLTAPASHVSAFDSTSKAVATTDLASGAAQGIWLKMSLAAAAAAFKSSYTIELDGQTT